MTEFTNMHWNELRKTAKDAGISVIGRKRAEIEAEMIAARSVDPNPAPREDVRPIAREETGRSARVPLGGARFKLSFPQRPGFARYWFNDRGGRIQDAIRAGYAHVEEEIDERLVKVSRRVGTQEDGSPMAGYLMEIRQEFYDEDKAAKLAVLDEIDAAIQGGAPRGNTAEPDRYYSPTEG